MSRLLTTRRYRTDVGGTGVHYKDVTGTIDVIDPTTVSGVVTSGGSASVVSDPHPEGGVAPMIQFVRSSGSGTSYLNIPCQVNPWTMGDAAGHFEVWIHIDTIPQHSTPGGPNPDTIAGGVTSFPSAMTVKFQDGTDNNGFSPVDSYRIRKGWNRVIVPHGNFTAYGTASWSTFAPTYVRVSLLAINGLTYTVKIAAVRFCAYRRPLVVNIFDDCRIGVQSYVLSLFSSLRMVGTLSVVGQLLTGENRFPGFGITADGGVNFMTKAQIQAAHAAGWDACNHSYTHYGQMHGHTYDAFKTEIRDAKTAMLEAGLTSHGSYARSFQAVGGGCSVTMFQVLQDEGFLYCGKVGNDSNPVIRDSYHTAHPYLRERYDTGTFEYNGGGTAKLATDALGPIPFIKDAVDRGAPAVLMWHNIVSGASGSTIQNSLAFLQATMEYQAAGNGTLFDVVTLGEYVSMIDTGLLGVTTVRS